MKAVVVYESMYGNTHLIANAIGEGLGAAVDVDVDVVVVPVGDADASLIGSADLVVVGGPTHAHGMSHASTRTGAVEAAEKPGSDLVLDDDAEGEGLREWFDRLESMPTNGAAFDTRADMAAALTGRASKGIARRLRRHGVHLVADPESFFVTKQNHLEPDEERRAREWGAQLRASLDRVAKR